MLFRSVFDLERILSRLEVGSANARDLVSLRASLAALPALKEKLQGAKSGLSKNYQPVSTCTGKSMIP